MISFDLQFGQKKIEKAENKSRHDSNECEDNESIDNKVNGVNCDLIRNNNETNISKQISIEEIEQLFGSQQKEFDLSDITIFIRAGIEAIVDDEVTKRFDTEGIH